MDLLKEVLRFTIYYIGIMMLATFTLVLLYEVIMV